MSTILFYYKIDFKVGTGHTPCQLVYGLHPLLPTKYLLPSKPGHNHDPTHVKILTSWLLELEKFQNNQLVAQDLVAFNQWNRLLWSQNWYIEPKY
jgi:hypothetical protein